MTPPRPRAVLCVTIDCECDKGPAWRTRRPLAFHGVHEGIGARLHPLFERFGAKPTYLLSPEVLRDPGCLERLRGLRGCELATHLHAELAEPGAFEPEVTDAVQRDLPPEQERAKLAWLTAAFRDAFGRPPVSFRAGRFGVGPHTVPILEELGYVVDSSVTPHVDWSHVSPGLSFVGAPTQPYHPDAADPSRTGGSRLLEVPVTVRPARLGRLPMVGRAFPARWLRPTRTSGAHLVSLAGEALRADATPARTVVLNAMLHNVEVVAGASPYAATDRAARRIVDRIATLLAFARDQAMPVVGLQDVPALVA